MSNELSILIPDQVITLRKKVKLTMLPCKVKQLKKILEIISKYIDKIAETEDMLQLAKYLLSDSGEQGLKDIYLALGSCTEITSQAFNLLVEKESTEASQEKESTEASQEFNRTAIFFDNLLYDELVLLVVKFLEMNKDFFKRVGEKLKPQEKETEQKAKTGASK